MNKELNKLRPSLELINVGEAFQPARWTKVKDDYNECEPPCVCY